MAGMYAVYHGPEGLRRIAGRIHGLTLVLAESLRRLGFEVAPKVSSIRFVYRLSKTQGDQIARGE